MENFPRGNIYRTNEKERGFLFASASRGMEKKRDGTTENFYKEGQGWKHSMSGHRSFVLCGL